VKILFLTQEEPFYLPIFFQNYFHHQIKDVDVVGVTIFPPFNASKNWKDTIYQYYQFYGIKDFLIQGVLFVLYKAFNIIRPLLPSKRFYSVSYVFKKYNVCNIKTNNVNSKEFITRLKELEVDLLISVACPKILKRILYESLPNGAINFHTGYLPRYRGINPLFWSMLNKELKTAISIHYINDYIDSGDIIVQKEIIIENGDSLDSLYKKVLTSGPSCLNIAIKDIMMNKLSLIKNDFSQSTCYGFPTNEDGKKFRKMGLKFR